MGKQTRGLFSDFVQEVPTSDPVKPTGFSDFVKAPLNKEAGRGLFAQTGSFKGESDYDKGLVFGADQNRLRAENQPWYDQLANAAVKTIPGIALGITENAGYIGELFSNDQDYTNGLTEIAQKGRQALEESNPNYHKNPGKITDFSDSAWWIDNGQGLVESIGEFLVTGAAVGGGLGQAGKLLSNAVKGTKAYSTANAGLNAAAALGTASTLAYTEGAMSGAQVYKDVYADQLNLHGNIELAKQKAAEAASVTVKLNTIINTGLNITSVTPLLKTFDNLYTTGRLGLNRKTGESLAAWSARLSELEAVGIPQASVKQRLVGEAVQEGLEEDVNLFAESEGRIKGGIEKSSSSSALTRFLNKAISEEGRLNFALGAIGGIGQTAGMDFAPIRTLTDAEGNTTRVSNHQLTELRENEFAKGVIATLQEDISYLQTKQKALNDAVAKGDKIAANKAKEDLFNVAALKSLREGYAEEFSEDMSKLARIDNTTIGEDGMTEAMRLGYADSEKDNEFKQKAMKKTGDLKKLSDEYNVIKQVFSDKFVADEVFRQRMNVYSANENVEELTKQNHIITTELLKGVTDQGATSIVDMTANSQALDELIKGLEKTAKTPEEQAILRNLKSTKLIEDQVIKQTLDLEPSLQALVDDNAGIVTQLVKNRLPLLYYSEELKQTKANYNKLVGNTKKTEEALLKVKNAYTDKLATEKVNAAKENEKNQEKKDAEITKAAKNTKYKEQVGAFRIESNKEGTFDVIDQDANIAISEHATAQEAREAAKRANENVKITGEQPVEGKSVVEEPVIIDTKTTQFEGYQGKTLADKNKEADYLDQVFSDNAINEEKVGRTNKFAYRAKENDDSPINPDYLILHSKEFNVGKKLMITVAADSKFFTPGMEEDRMPIGIYADGKIVGYVALPKANETELKELRSRIINGGLVETTVSDKDFGVINKSEKQHIVAEAMPIIKDIAIAKDNTLLTGVNKVYAEPLVNNLEKSPVKNGITHAIITTPNGKDIAIPLDTSKVAPEVVDSVMTAFRIYLSSESILPEDNALLDEIFNKFDIDLRSAKGFEKYFKSFFHNFVFSKANINELNADKNDKFWVEFDGENIKYLSSGRAVTDAKGNLQPKKVGKKTPGELQEGFINELTKHLENMYYNVDLVALENNAPVSLPILSFKDDALTYREYSKPSYKDYIKSITKTNVVGIKVSDSEYTYFVNPRLYFNTSFMGKENTENYAKPMQKPTEKAILAPSPKKTVRSLTTRLSSSISDVNQVTKEVIEERKKACE